LPGDFLFRDIIEEVDRAAGSDVRVLISGDTMIGKDVIARRIHEQSARHLGPFVAMNCATAAGDLVGSLERADHGTLFLDRIGEADSHLQETLLTCLETGDLDVRIIAASGRDLHQGVIDGRFNASLFYRLNIIHILIAERDGRERAMSPRLDEHGRDEPSHELGASS
jgi:anaerobic nitric oxide reductase transcription regulator